MILLYPKKSGKSQFYENFVDRTILCFVILKSLYQGWKISQHVVEKNVHISHISCVSDVFFLWRFTSFSVEQICQTILKIVFYNYSVSVFCPLSPRLGPRPRIFRVIKSEQFENLLLFFYLRIFGIFQNHSIPESNNCYWSRLYSSYKGLYVSTSKM